MKKITTCFLFLFYFSISIYSQYPNPRKTYKSGFSFTLGGPTLALSFSLNHFFNEHVNMEIGGGFIGAYGGIKYYYGRKMKVMRFAPYTGLCYNYSASLFEYPCPGIYVPLGVQLMSKRGFTLGLEAAFEHRYGHYNYSFPWAALKIGANI